MKKGYPWIDRMRMVAAILVVSIHISPLLQLNATADFILTRIVGRLAVPFFFITTSYFLFINGYPSNEKIKKTLIQLSQWYLLSMLIYFPIMIYNHYFQSSDLFIIIKDLLIDGTFYHLWYFPAVMIGIIIVLVLKKYFSIKVSFIVTLFLYFIGLCGDSYYGVIQVPIIKDFINGLFQYMDYTRNGFFFAPLFLMIGVFITEHQSRLTLKGNIVLLVISFLLMSLEAQKIHMLEIVKHDSMYILLPVVSYFLFQLLILHQGERHKNMKDISLYIYIIHPMMIVIVRMIGKTLKLNVIVSHNFIQFICVITLSIGISILINQYLQRGERNETNNV